MGQQVCMGAMMKCSFGAAPSSLTVLPTHRTLTKKPAANIMDSKPMLNVKPFVMCRSMANPMVIAATALALGKLTPMPCVPNIPGPWIVGAPTVLLDGMPTLNNSAKLMCAWAGVIQISFAGQATVLVP